MVMAMIQAVEISAVRTMSGSACQSLVRVLSTRSKSLPSIRHVRRAAVASLLQRGSAPHQSVALVEADIDDRGFTARKRHAVIALVSGSRRRDVIRPQAAQLVPHGVRGHIVEAPQIEQVAQHTQDLPTRSRLPYRLCCAGLALPHALEIDVAAGGLRKRADREQH